MRKFLLFSLLTLWPLAGFAQQAPIALVGGILLDRYEADTVRDAVVVLPGIERVGRTY